MSFGTRGFEHSLVLSTARCFKFAMLHLADWTHFVGIALVSWFDLFQFLINSASVCFISHYQLQLCHHCIIPHYIQTFQISDFSISLNWMWFMYITPLSDKKYYQYKGTDTKTRKKTIWVHHSAHSDWRYDWNRSSNIHHDPTQSMECEYDRFNTSI